MESEFDWDAWYKKPGGRKRSKEAIRFFINVPIFDLLNHVLEQAGGDDYDGAFTKWGRYEYEMCKYVLERRIRALIKNELS